MTYAVFKYSPSNKDVGLVQAIATTIRTTESELSEFGAGINQFLNAKYWQRTKEMMITHVACRLGKADNVRIVKLPTALSTDKQLRKFGESYLGCISGTVSQTQLLRAIHRFRQLDDTSNLRQILCPNLGLIPHTYSYAALGDDEIAELTAIHEVSRGPLEAWIASREAKVFDEIASDNPLLKRDF